MAFLADLGFEAGLDAGEVGRRGAGLFLLFCAGNLADDLMDHECNYLESPIRLAPPLVYLLLNLGWSTLAGTSVSRQVLCDAQRDLARGAGAQVPEVRRRTFSFEEYRAIAEGIAGRQWDAYVTVLTDGAGAPLGESRAGFHLGCAALVVSDVRSPSGRWGGLSHDDKRRALAWATDHAERAVQTGWVTIQRTGRVFLDALRALTLTPATTAAGGLS